MDVIKPPEPLKLTGNIDYAWKQFKQAFQLYLTATGANDKSSERKVALVLTTAGSQAIEIFNMFEFTDGDEKKLSNVLEQFDAYCSPKKNEVYKRHVFRCRIQQQDESFDSYVTELRLKVKSCNYGDMQSSMLRDQIVFGIHN